MAKINLEELLVGKKMEPRYMEYNWRMLLCMRWLSVPGTNDLILHI